MKKVFFNYLAIAALAVGAAFTSCDDDIEQVVTVTFDSKGGSDITAQTVKKGGKLTEPKDPTRKDYDFAGWATADDKTSPLWDFERNFVEADMILYARWNENENGNDVVKLLEALSWSSGDYTKFEYDNQDRITKILFYEEGKVYSTETLTYSGNDLVKSETTYAGNSDIRTIDFGKSGNGNTFTFSYKWNGEEDSSPLIVTLNSNGLPVKFESSEDDNTWVSTYQYQGNNFTKISWKGTNQGEEWEGSSDFKYDNNMSPLYHCKTPKWYLICWFEDEFGVHNNMIEATWENGKIVYTYVFDIDGYPTKQTAKAEYDDEDEDYEWECMFTYKTK